MKSANRIQKALAAKNTATFGAWQMLPGTNLSRAIARAGFDWICVDCEHGNIAGLPTTLIPPAHISKLLALPLPFPSHSLTPTRPSNARVRRRYRLLRRLSHRTHPRQPRLDG